MGVYIEFGEGLVVEFRVLKFFFEIYIVVI